MSGSRLPDAGDPEPTDEDRYPTLMEAGRKMLDFLQEHPRAPIYRNRSGNRLTVDDLEAVRRFRRDVFAAGPSSAGPDGSGSEELGWRSELLERCFELVPHYRRMQAVPDHWDDIPTVDRGDLARDVAQFVPDDVSLDRLINFQTTGTTGHPLLLPSHPIVAANYLAFHEKALARFGITLQHGAGQVGVVLIGWQSKCFTYVSVTPMRGEAGLAKINLHPVDWRDPDDRAAYLDDLRPEIVTGDPLSFAELLRLPVTFRPRALLSTSMSLSSALLQALEVRFECPVLDVYSLNEAGPIAVFDRELDGHVLLQHCMFVEVVDAEGRSLPPGERGEVTLTGGFNHCLPLLRYRTGDWASLERSDGEWALMGLEGRPPVRFRTVDGRWINNIEVTHALRRFPIPQFALHQDVDGELHLRLSHRLADRDAVVAALDALFGTGPGCSRALRVEEGVAADGKVVQYTSDLEGSGPPVGTS